MFFISFSVLLIGNPESSVASGSSSTHPHTNTLELKPTSLDNSFKTSSVCFMGYGDCDPNAGFDKGDDSYIRDSSEMCKEEGYQITKCTLPSYLSNQCPYDDNYYKACVENKDLTCREAEFTKSCPDGEILNEAEVCPYGASYKKCKVAENNEDCTDFTKTSCNNTEYCTSCNDGTTTWYKIDGCISTYHDHATENVCHENDCRDIEHSGSSLHIFTQKNCPEYMSCFSCLDKHGWWFEYSSCMSGYIKKQNPNGGVYDDILS